MTEEIKREYIIPLRRGFQNTPRYKRTHKAIRVLKEFIVKNMKSEDIKIGKHLNEFLWKDGIKNPPCRVKVIVTKDKENVVRAELFGFDYVDFKQITEEEPKNLKEKLQSKLKTAPKEKTEETTETKKPTSKPKPVAKKVEEIPEQEEELLETDFEEEKLLEEPAKKTSSKKTN